jgi:leucyl-tRNA synthetase
MMELVNQMTEVSGRAAEPAVQPAYSEACEVLTLVLAPFTPHLAEELWHRLGRAGGVHAATWPPWDEAVAAEETVTVVIQVNGRLRDRLVVAPDTSEEELREQALASEKVKPFIDRKAVRQVVVVPGRLVNIVVS